MPLLRRQPFRKEVLPDNLQENEELFYCKLTKEVFRDYDAFFERVILCNSLVWTCELTGRPGLTYLEAVESEERARASLMAMPVALKRALLYLARHSNRGRLSDLCDDVFYYVKDRFFVGEEVEGVVDGNRHCCKIKKVVAPHSGKRKPSGSSVPLNDSSCNEQDECDADTGSSELNPNVFKYQVFVCDNSSKDDQILHLLTADDVMRKKGVYSREKNRLFLKHACTLHNSQWAVKSKFIKKYNIDDTKLKDIFAGAKPNLEAVMIRKKQSSGTSVSSGIPKQKVKESDKKKIKEKAKVDGKQPVKKKSANDEKALKSEAKKVGKHKDKDSVVAKEEKPTMEDRRKAKEELKQKMEEERRKRKEEKDKEREKLREERRIMAECLREWQKPRDDLECDDLMDLPDTVPVDCGIPNEVFGDALMVLEFVHNFSDLLSARDRFPQGLTLELLDKALVEKDFQGPLNDLLQLLLQGVFSFQEEEEEEGDDDDEEWHTRKGPDEKTNDVDGSNEDCRSTSTASSWPDYYHCIPIRKMALDAFTLTEILRLHFLAFRSRSSSFEYSLSGDPLLQLCSQESDLIQALGYRTVFDLSPGAKLKIIQTLISQLLSFGTLRDEIEERLEKLRIAKQDLKQLQWARQRREKEEAALRFRKRMEEKAKAESSSVPLPAQIVGRKLDMVTEEVKEQTKLGKDQEVKSIDMFGEEAPANAKRKEEKIASKRAKQKQEFIKKELELSEAVAKLQNRGIMCPLGRDRAYRRFWMISALPGLFVEDDDSHVGTCLPQPTPHNPYSNPYMSFNHSITLARHQAQKSAGDLSNASDKENEAKGKLCLANQNNTAIPNSKVHKNHKLLSDNHPTINGVADDLKVNLENIKLESVENTGPSEKKTAIFGVCNASGDSCSVHGIRKCTKWSFFATTSQVELLIASLNPRGYREGSLKEILVAEKRKVVHSVSKCPVANLNPSVKLDDMCASSQPEVVRKSSRSNPILSASPSESSLDDAFELTLRDSILDMEEKIYAGGLGLIKVKDRVAWREALVQKTYDRQCETLCWRSKADCKVILNGIYVDRGNGNLDSLEEEKTSASSPKPANPVIFQLGCALLQIYQGIEAKYLQFPLVPDREEGDANPKSQQKPLVERWEESLMSSTSLSQLFVHLATLEKSVAWSKSILNARCRLCRRKGDAEHMLLCDGCDRGHHMYCLKPPLKEIPEGDWLCSDCSPKKSPQRRSRKRPAKDIEDNFDEEDCLQPRRKVQEVECTTTTSDAELAKIKLRSDDKVENVVCCFTCKGSSGHLIRCCRCKYSYHCECVDPPLAKIPRGKWVCLKCFIHTPPKRRLKKRRSEKEGHVKAKLVRRKKEVISPRRSERNIGRRVRYDKHSIYFDDAEWNGKKLRKSSRLLQEAISDEEYYRLTRRQMPPIRRGASEDVPLDYKVCDELLTELVRNEDSWPFLRPVGKREMPNYRDVVKRTMDFGTMRSKLNAMLYQNNKEFVADAMLVFQNCCVFNPVNSVEYQAAERLGRYLQRRIRELKLKLVPFEVDSATNGCDEERHQWTCASGDHTESDYDVSEEEYDVDDRDVENEDDDDVEFDEQLLDGDDDDDDDDDDNDGDDDDDINDDFDLEEENDPGSENEAGESDGWGEVVEGEENEDDEEEDEIEDSDDCNPLEEDMVVVEDDEEGNSDGKSDVIKELQEVTCNGFHENDVVSAT